MFNKKAQMGPVGAVFSFLVFVIIWFVWLGGWVATLGKQIVTDNNLVGIWAFLCYNLNFVILLSLILGIVGYSFFGGNQ